MRHWSIEKKYEWAIHIVIIVALEHIDKLV
jgi:hypothetical protein